MTMSREQTKISDQAASNCALDLSTNSDTLSRARLVKAIARTSQYDHGGCLIVW
jgi:hypothetical protein